MRNRYFETNFSNKVVDAPDLETVDVSYSNSLYDEYRFVSHAFVEVTNPDGTKIKRLINDVELCMSNSPEVLAAVSPDYQQRLREGLLNQRRSAPRNGRVSDSDLMDNVIPAGLEHDEAANLAKYKLDGLRASIDSKPVDSSVEPLDKSLSDTPPVDSPAE